MTDAPDLLPCPFCGLSNATAQTDSETFHDQHLGMVRCLDCDATGPLPENSHDTPEEAISAAVLKWNTRASPMTTAEAAKLLLGCSKFADAVCEQMGEGPGDLEDVLDALRAISENNQ